jgi:hypothetical protein
MNIDYRRNFYTSQEQQRRWNDRDSRFHGNDMCLLHFSLPFFFYDLVSEKHAIEMIYLVLDDASRKIREDESNIFSFEIDIIEFDFLISDDISEFSWHTETTFRIDTSLFRMFSNDRIYHPENLIALIVRSLH